VSRGHQKSGRLFKHVGTCVMVTRTVELDRNDLDKSIGVLSSAAQALQLTRFERVSYQALTVSVDLVAAVIFAVFVMGVVERLSDWALPDYAAEWLSLAWFVCILIGMVSLALNIALFRKVFRERARLKKLGLSSLSRSLWKESRQSRWISRAHGTLLIVAGIILLFMIAFWFNYHAYVSSTVHVEVPTAEQFYGVLAFFVLTMFVVLCLLIATRYLRNQRERLDLTANAEELRKALQSLRRRAGDVEIVTIPSDLLERTAKIESAQIAEERKDAILESVASRPTGYAIAFDGDAAEQRATLDVADRIELGDLVAQLSIAGMQPERRQGMQRDKTESKRVEIDYVIDNASRSIRVIAVRRVREVSDVSTSGGSHA
jgi:hypothetical protein